MLHIPSREEQDEMRQEQLDADARYKAESARAMPEQVQTPGVAAVAAGSPALSVAEIARRFMRARYGAVPAEEEAKDRYMTRLGLVFDALHFAENEAQENNKVRDARAESGASPSVEAPAE